ncbi:MAG: Flp pilus assembly secretin CpaC, partial [Verrucomicrobiales bacterium]
WTTDAGRKVYDLRVNRDLQALESAIAAIEGEITIEESSDSRTLLLKGEVPTKEEAEAAGKRIQEVLETLSEPRPGLVNLLTFPVPDDPLLEVDQGLLDALHAIDERIIMRRIRVVDGEAETSKERDSYVLEGKVRNIRDLTKAIYIADRQLGGSGGRIQAADETKIRSQRRQSFNSNFASSGKNDGASVLKGSELIPNGLAAQIARGLILSSESGRVISFLEVDRLEQIMVSIRVLEIDRRKARALGVNYRIDAKHFSAGSLNVPIGTQFPVVGDDAVSALGAQGGNIVGSYVSETAGLMAAIEVLQEKAVARSVAEPNVLTLTGEEASVLVGGEVPIPTTAIGNVASVQGFDFQSFGVRLDIRPTITEDGKVTLEVAPSIVQPNLALGNGAVPGFEVQTVQTTARVPAGDSLLLGGLLTFEEGMEERGIPIISRIPILGYLFKWKRKFRDEKELLFVMTPRLIDETETQIIPELPELLTRDQPVDDSLTPQKLEVIGVPELWRNPEPAYPPDLWSPEREAERQAVKDAAAAKTAAAKAAAEKAKATPYDPNAPANQPIRLRSPKKVLEPTPAPAKPEPGASTSGGDANQMVVYLGLPFSRYKFPFQTTSILHRGNIWRAAHDLRERSAFLGKDATDEPAQLVNLTKQLAK